MVTDLIEPDFNSLAFIASYMRQADQDEIYNAIGHRNPFLLAGATLDAMRMGSGVVAHVCGRPAACIGLFSDHPGVGVVFAYGTNDFNRVALSLTRYALRVMKPAAIEAGLHRLECKSRFDHVTAHRWLERMGFVAEGTLKQYGSDGSDYIQFGATNNVLSINAETEEAAAAAEQARYAE